MKTKKLLALVLVLSLLSGCFSLIASASDTEVKYIMPLSPVLHDSPGNMKDSLSAFRDSVNEEAFRELILTSVAECDNSIDISEFYIPVSVYGAVLDYIWYNMPEAFNVKSLGASYTEEGLLSLTVIYRDFADTEAEYTACLKEFNDGANSILSGIKNNSALSDCEKALLLHDRLCLAAEYDFVTDTEVKHTAYGAFAKGKAVCQGYAMAYMYLLQQVGIKNYYCSSETLDHSWNIVYINSIPYHVDVTWDDISWGGHGRGIEGRVEHDNFLRSTEGIRTADHNAADFDTSPSDKSFDSAFWQNSTTAFQLINNEIYYIDNTSQALIRMSDKMTVRDLRASWYYSNGGIWPDNYACLDSEKGYLLYSLPDGVYKYSPFTDTLEKIYSPSLSGYNSIFGFTYKDGSLVCDINVHPADASTLSQVKYSYTDFDRSVLSVTLGRLPFNTTYNKDDTADHSGLYLVKKYTDGTWEEITSGFEITGFDTSAIGEKELTVHYEGYTFTFKINVVCAHLDTRDVPEVKPTCENTGRTAGVYCNDCKTYISGYEVIPVNKNNHKWDSGRVTEAASCTKEGKLTYTCIYNSSHTKTEKTAYDENTHLNLINTPETEGTCTTPAYSAGVYCNDCKKYISGHEEIPMKDIPFEETENMLLFVDTVIVFSDITVKDILSHSKKGAAVTDKNGRALSTDEAIPTGAVLKIDDCTQYELVLSGDVNGDGKVSAADARLTLRASVGLEAYKKESSEMKAADVNGKGITASDARLILRASVGLENRKEWLVAYKE